MVDFLKVISGAYELYKANWRSVITAFAVIFLIEVVFGFTNFFAQLPGNFICNGANNTWLILIFCISPIILQFILGVINGLLIVLITMAVIRPMDEMALGQSVSSWIEHFPKQLVNAIMVIILRSIVILISFTPLIIVVILNLSTLVALRGRQDLGILFAGGLLVVVLMLVLGIIVFTILNFLLMFLDIEMVLGGGSVIEAAMKSANIVKNNLVDIVIYSLLWMLIGIGVSIVTLLIACTICLLPLAWLIPPFIVEPIGILSRVMLWREFRKSG